MRIFCIYAAIFRIGSIAKIEASGASYEDLTTAATWAQGQDDVTLPTHQPLTGLAAYLYEVLIADEDIWGEEHRA